MLQRLAYWDQLKSREARRCRGHFLTAFQRWWWDCMIKDWRFCSTDSHTLCWAWKIKSWQFGSPNPHNLSDGNDATRLRRSQPRMRTKELNFVVWQSQPSLLAVAENQRLLTSAQKSRAYDDEFRVQSYMFIKLLPTTKKKTPLKNLIQSL